MEKGHAIKINCFSVGKDPTVEVQIQEKFFSSLWTKFARPKECSVRLVLHDLLELPLLWKRPTLRIYVNPFDVVAEAPQLRT